MVRSAVIRFQLVQLAVVSAATWSDVRDANWRSSRAFRLAVVRLLICSVVRGLDLGRAETSVRRSSARSGWPWSAPHLVGGQGGDLAAGQRPAGWTSAFSWSVSGRAGRWWTGPEVAGLDGTELVRVQRHDLVGLQRGDLRASGHHAGGGQAVELVGADGLPLARSSAAPTSSVERALTWSELRPARAPVVMDAGRLFPACWPDRWSGRHLVGVQRRELGGAQAFRLPVVRLLIWSVVRACTCRSSVCRSGRWSARSGWVVRARPAARWSATHLAAGQRLQLVRRQGIDLVGVKGRRATVVSD